MSWYQPEPLLSLELVDALGVTPDAAVIDIGGGASLFVRRLLDRGFTDLTVLDISNAALQIARQQVSHPSEIEWINKDLLLWTPTRRYDLLHDRAVFHFLVNEGDIAAYRAMLDRAVAPFGSVIVATFALEGPDHCSGLPVTRYSADDLGAALGNGFEIVECRREIHTTPADVAQPYTWIGMQRVPQ